MAGKVYLVGAGPGNAGLLTLRGAEVLARAETVVYDRLAAPELLALAPEAARRIYVGKSPEGHTLEQDEINALLVSEGRAGRTVVRLKGGDPFVFGRGGEEALALREAGIEFEVVPGVTAGLAGPAFAGIPVTHRGVSSAVALVTGHEEPGKAESDLDYAALARIGTVVFYMGVAQIGEIARRLMKEGRAGETPVAIIERATTARQRTVRATLATAAERVRTEKVQAPAVTVVGEVAALGERLAWVERQPLWGRTILVTRTREQASDLVRQLRDLGARVLELPTIAIEPLPQDELAGAIEDLAEFDWLAFTSANAVDLFFKCLTDGGSDARALAGRRVAAIGPATAARLAEHGIRADLEPEEAVAESLAAALLEAGVGGGTRVLLPRAAEARDVLVETLRQEGALVEEIAVYRTVVPAAVDEASLEALRAGEVDLVTLTSSSTARHFVSLIQSRGGEELLARIKGQLKFASIGPITSNTATELGLTVAVESAEHTVPALVETIRRWAGK